MPQMRERVPLVAWRAARLASVLTAVAVCGLLVANGELGLKLVWGVIVPVLPLLFVVAPGFWRNVCPIAAVNQAPRVFGFSLARTLPGTARRYSFLVAVALFLVIVPLRPALLETSGTALAALFAVTLVAAFAGVLVFKGKSGFCGTFCPLAPVQRLYGQTPLRGRPEQPLQPLRRLPEELLRLQPACRADRRRLRRGRDLVGFAQDLCRPFPRLRLGVLRPVGG